MEQAGRQGGASSAVWFAGIAVALVAWVFTYTHLDAGADFIAGLLGTARHGGFGEAFRFFVYEVPKVLLLLLLVVFAMGVVHTFVSPDRTRALLAGRREGAGNAMAAALGVVTPFCSCSAVPLFIGFLQAGVPLGVTFSFLVSAPMVNEVALALLFGMFGWQVGTLYLVMGLLVAIVSGFVIGKLKMEAHLEPWVRELQQGGARPAYAVQPLDWPARFREGLRHVNEIVGRVWIYIVIGVGAGAAVHGFVPERFMASLMGRGDWWGVPVAVLCGVPMYSNAAGILPVVEALMRKGAAPGTVLAFMMSVIALSAPEMIILRKVLRPRLIAVFACVVAAGIVVVGYLFNAVL
jgi:uncharacterized membrane protein YraQ (UPF0718 family)